jgi:putative PIN family toxin of toxin-antitoxin system
MNTVRAVLDTNVLVAALRSAVGASNEILRRLHRREFVLLASTPLWLEYESVLKREDSIAAHGLSAADIDDLLDILAVASEEIALHFHWRPQLRDPDDEMVIETALNGQADVLVTFNLTDFEHACRNLNVRLMTPAAFVDLLRKRS